jgi:putative peptidoglycan lipid II flippase
MIFRIQSFKQAAFWSTAIGAFSQGLALVFGMVMAALFGAQESTDVLYYCLGVFALLSSLIQQVNVSVLVPETMRRREQTGEGDAMAFINRFLAVFCVLILAATGAILFHPAGILTAISRFPMDLLELNRRLVLWLVIAFPLQMVAQILLDILVSYRFLTLPAVLSCVGRVINIVFVLAFYRWWGVVSAAIGMAIGFAVQILVNAWFLQRAIHWRWEAWRTQIGAVVYQNILWTELGTVVSAAASYLPLYLFTGFSAGALTALNYAQRLSRVPLDVLTAQFSSVTAIKFNELVARRQEAELNVSFGRLARVVVFVLMPLSVLMALIGHDLVSILFGRGKFQGEALQMTALLFSVFVLNLPLTGFMTVLARYLVAHQAIRFGVLWQIFSNGLNMVVVAVSIYVWGPIGFPVGLCFHLLAYMSIISVSMVRRFPGLPLWPVWRSFAATAAACGISGVPVVLFRAWAGASFAPWALGAISTLLYGLICGAWLFLWPPDRLAFDYCRNLAGPLLRAAKGVFPSRRSSTENRDA